jgi:DNA topoisomerase-3
MTTTVEIEIAGEEFSASGAFLPCLSCLLFSRQLQSPLTGLIIRERNYLDVYIYDKWNGNHLPDFEVGERFMPDELELREGATTQPDLLTEADLVSLMDKNGIGPLSPPFPTSLLVLTPSRPVGTDATIAEHIAKIIDREYVFKQRDGQVERLVPSTLGIGLVKAYDQVGLDNSLSKPHLRRLVRPPVLPPFALSPC